MYRLVYILKIKHIFRCYAIFLFGLHDFIRRIAFKSIQMTKKNRKDPLKSCSDQQFRFSIWWESFNLYLFMLVFIVGEKSYINFHREHVKTSEICMRNMMGTIIEWCLIWGSIHFRKWQTINLFSLFVRLFYSSIH